MRNLLLFAVLLGIFLQASSQECERFLSDSSLAHATMSLCIIDTKTGESIFDYNSARSLAPASVMKLITSAAALELLGPGYTFKTELGYSGTLNRSGKLSGDIIIRGGGDPVFASPRFSGYYDSFPERWIDELKRAGIKKVKGRVITDDSYYDFLPVPAKWLWEDAGNYYGAGVFGASVYDNTYEIHLSPGTDSSKVQIKAITPPECRFEFSNWLTAAGTSDEGYVFAAPYSTNGWLAGTVPESRNDFVLRASITDPPMLLAKIMDVNLELAGIKVSGEPSTVRLLKTGETTNFVSVSEITSPPVADIIEALNHESVNLYAEHLLKELGKKLKSNGSTVSGIEVIYAFLKIAGLDTTGIFIEDGSGLSPVNSINTRQLVNLLTYMKNKGMYFSEYFRSLPEGGKEGTLKNYFKDPAFESCLRAKSGTLTRVKSYAGYVTTMSGRQLAFAMIANDFNGRSAHIVSLFEDVLKEVILNK